MSPPTTPVTSPTDPSTIPSALGHGVKNTIVCFHSPVAAPTLREGPTMPANSGGSRPRRTLLAAGSLSSLMMPATEVSHQCRQYKKAVLLAPDLRIPLMQLEGP